MVFISIQFLFVISFQLLFSPTEELVVISKGKACGQNDTSGRCAKAAIIRGHISIGLPEMCYKRVDPGPCGRDMIRVYFDSKTSRCKHFSYSGCGGNANRFVSIKNCYQMCTPGYRTRIIGIPPTTTTICPPHPRKKVKLNVTSVEQIEVEV